MQFLKNILLFAFLWKSFVIVKIFAAGYRMVGYRKRQKSTADPSRPLKVLYLAAFFPENAGFRYRVQKWADLLNAHHIRADVKYVLERNQLDTYRVTNDIRLYLIPLIRRFFQCQSARNYDVVIVRRELLLFNQYGNLFMEKFLHAIHPNVILDFDDDIAAAKGEPRKLTFFGKLLMEHPSKFSATLTSYKRFIVGSSYLKERLKRTNKAVKDGQILVIPTCVDYQKYEAKVYRAETDQIVFGWIGGTGNLKLLDHILPSLERVSKRFAIKLMVISGKDYSPDTDLEVVNIKWSIDTQVANMKKFDIGLMPLRSTQVAKGKCGFKLIQYMGLGIVSIASAVTINKEIIEDGVNGYLVHDDHWEETLVKAIHDYPLFRKKGMAARKKIESNYTFDANKSRYMDFIQG